MSRTLLKQALFVLFFITVRLYNLNAQTSDSLFSMDLTDLMNVSVVTASNMSEKLSQAPANVIVIDKNDIQLRGYTTISDVYADLPGMDVSNTFGFQGVRNTIRGFRAPFGDSYLFMVDGVIFNQLWFNEAIAQNAVPMSNVERIEIVYGPASSVYGANAFMGVVNVITKKDDDTDGVHTNLNTRLGSNAFNGDYNMFYKNGDFRMSMTTRFDNWALYERIDDSQYEWSKLSLQKDRDLWGGVVDNPQLIKSPEVKNMGFDLRSYYKSIEVGFQYYKVDQGYGMIFPYDKSLASNEQPMTDYSIHLRHQKSISDDISVQTLVRYRVSNVSGETNFIEGYNIANNDTVDAIIGGVTVNPGESARVVDYSTWGVYCLSYSLNQSIEYRIVPKLLLSAGYKFEYKDLQKGWQVSYGDAYAPSVLSITDPGFLTSSQNLSRNYENRVIWKDNGGYALLKYDINNNNILNLGARIDNNSTYGTSVTFRGGYVLTVNQLILKLLYGEAFREPSPRTLYGGWSGVGSDPELDPEKSRTIETSLGYTTGKFASLFDLYYVNNTNTIETFTGGAQNLGNRSIIGTDVFLTSLLYNSYFKQLKVWGYGSFIIKEEQQYYDDNGVETEVNRIGDLAHTKLYAGITGTANKYIALSLRGRYIGQRETVLSNPIESVDGYLTLDANIIFKDVLFKGLNLSLQVNNILNTQYAHPGTRSADAGNSAGSWNNYEWNGSRGWNNSLMPQPGRYILVGMHLIL